MVKSPVRVTLTAMTSTLFSKCTQPTRHSGFSLLELLVVLLIVAALMVLAGPSFTTSLQNSRLQSAVGALGTDMAFARSEATTRREPVTLCASTDGNSCAGSAWESGWVVFVDDGAGGGTSGNGSRDGSETLLKVAEASSAGVTIRSQNFAYGNWVMLQGSGRLGFAEGGTFVFCDSRGIENAMAVNLNGVGYVRLAEDNDGDDVPEDDLGAPTKCT